MLPPPTPMEYLLVSGSVGAFGAFYTLDGQSSQSLCQAMLESHLRDGKTEAQMSGDLTGVGAGLRRHEQGVRKGSDTWGVTPELWGGSGDYSHRSEDRGN